MDALTWLAAVAGLLAVGFLSARTILGPSAASALVLRPRGAAEFAPLNDATRQLLAALTNYRNAFEQSMARDGAAEAAARHAAADVVVHRWGLGRILSRLAEEAERGMVAARLPATAAGDTAAAGTGDDITTCRFVYEGLTFTLTTIGEPARAAEDIASRSLALSVEGVPVFTLAGLRRTVGGRYDWAAAEVTGFQPGHWIGALCSLDCRLGTAGQAH